MLQNELAETYSLDGTWDFSLGENAPWGTIQVPGCWEAQGFDMLSDGPATYRRDFQIPASWHGKHIQLEFDAASYACTVSLNGTQVGEHRGLWSPFAFDVTAAARCSDSNILEVTIHKPGSYGDAQARYPMRSSLAGFIPDIATTFGGLWQSVRLRAFSIALEDVRVTPSYAAGALHVLSQARVFSSQVPAPAQFAWSVEVNLDGQFICSHEQPVDLPASPDAAIPPLELILPVPEVQPWSPQKPNLYKVKIRLLEQGQPLANLATRTGFRALAADGSQLLLNGEPFMARGILSWGWEPERIAPTYTPEQARAEIRRVRELGFNLVKLCLLVPSPAYFDVADEEGMLLWEELPMWLPEVTDDLRRQAPLEYQEIAGHLQRHPSVALSSASPSTASCSRSSTRPCAARSPTYYYATTAVPASPTAAWISTSPTSPITTPITISTISSPCSITGAETGRNRAPGSSASSAILTPSATHKRSSTPTEGSVPGG